MTFLGIFSLKFKNIFVIFEISTLDYCQILKFVQSKKKNTNLGPKMPYEGILDC